jgi:N-acetyl-alpha-D-muramate 1-phosphate uridylyltransferase
MLPVAILAGGLATRLRPLTTDVPKSLIPVNGEPFIAHQLRLLRDRGVDRVVLCLGYLGEMIEDFVGRGDRFGLQVDYSWDGPTPQGTGGAVRKALPLLGESFLVMYGDSYLLCDYLAVERSFLASGKQALMTVFRNEGQWDTSNVEFCEGEILAYDKRHRTPRMLHIDYGLGAFQSHLFEELPEAGGDLAAVFQNALAGNELAAIEIDQRFYEIGSFDGLQSLSDAIANGVPGTGAHV